eukprot:COSAG05_NODE_6674_length_922_cov_1.046173_1_plen_25_part_01
MFFVFTANTSTLLALSSVGVASLLR